jgi:membrane-associated protease RseP (regulator of RpoE activity)
MRWKASLLALLLLAPTASRVAATGNPTPTPESEIKEKPKEKVRKHKKVVVEIPEIVVDDDRVFLEGEDGPEMLADLGELRELGEWNELEWFQGGGFIGVRPLEMTPELRTHFGAPGEAGVLIAKVETDSPAARAGIQVGDIVTSADGEKVERKRDLVRAIRRKKEGDTVRIELVRDRASKTLTVTVAEREDGQIRVGDFGPGMRKFHHRMRPMPPVPPVPPVAPVPPSPGLQERLDDFEKRLDALESRVPRKQSL